MLSVFYVNRGSQNVDFVNLLYRTLNLLRLRATQFDLLGIPVRLAMKTAQKAAHSGQVANRRVDFHAILF